MAEFGVAEAALHNDELLFSIVANNAILTLDFIHNRGKTGEDPMTAALDSIRACATARS